MKGEGEEDQTRESKKEKKTTRTSAKIFSLLGKKSFVLEEEEGERERERRVRGDVGSGFR